MAGSMQEYADLRAAYIAELDTVMPPLNAWWANLDPFAGGLPREKRWPTGLAGHPRIIAIFRSYFVRIDQLNIDNEFAWVDQQTEHSEVDIWSGTARDPVLLFQRPQDLLIRDLADDRPDLHEIMQGMAMIPIGMNHHKDLV